jgi:hypothetical protein
MHSYTALNTYTVIVLRQVISLSNQLQIARDIKQLFVVVLRLFGIIIRLDFNTLR